MGCRVHGIDKDPTKVDRIRAGAAPFYEPGLHDIVRETVGSGLLTAGSELSHPVLAAADIALICVGTPPAQDGSLSLDQLTRVLRDIRNSVAPRTRPLILAIRSTVFPGDTEELAGPLLSEFPFLSLVSNPEFLREGVAIRDFLEPSLLVVGGSDANAVSAVAALYTPLGVEPCLVSLRTAEMIKFCSNAFHALKIAFANEVGNLASRLCVSPQQVMNTLCRDTRLNISSAYLKPGFAFGGSCLSKDLRALTQAAQGLGLELPLLESVLPSNQRHLRRAIDRVLELSASRIAVFGLAFKEGTDDLRESPGVLAIQRWVAEGKQVRVYDPHIRLDLIYGSNRQFVLAALPYIDRVLCSDLDDMLGWCECVVLTQLPSAQHADRIAASGKPIIDLAGASSLPRAG
jgi:GDP-mannose 6-dehydrogenase